MAQNLGGARYCTGDTSGMMKGLRDAFDGLEDMMTVSNPRGRIAEPDEIPHAVRCLLSDEASFGTGTMMIVGGDLTAA